MIASDYQGRRNSFQNEGYPLKSGICADNKNEAQHFMEREQWPPASTVLTSLIVAIFTIPQQFSEGYLNYYDCFTSQVNCVMGKYFEFMLFSVLLFGTYRNIQELDSHSSPSNLCNILRVYNIEREYKFKIYPEQLKVEMGKKEATNMQQESFSL